MSIGLISSSPDVVDNDVKKWGFMGVYLILIILKHDKMTDIETINGKKYTLKSVPFRSGFIKVTDAETIATAHCIYCEFNTYDKSCKELNRKHDCVHKNACWNLAKHTDILSEL